MANLGDSRAAYCHVSQDGENTLIKALSFDHKPADPAENQRIQNAGYLMRNKRIWNPEYFDPEKGTCKNGLAVSRAIGDFSFKKNFND